MTNEEEIWKAIPEWPLYSASTEGRIRRNQTGVNTKPNRIKKAQVNKKTGYCHIKLSRHNPEMKLLEKRSMSVHRIVATTFIENPEAKREVDHINNDKTDNRVENLRWCTRRENLSNMQGRRGIGPIEATAPTGEVYVFDCIRDAAKAITEMTGKRFFPQGISNVVGDYATNTHYRRWKFRYLDPE